MYVMCGCIFGASFLDVWRRRWLWDLIRGKYQGISLYPIGEFLRLYRRTSRRILAACPRASSRLACHALVSSLESIHLSLYVSPPHGHPRRLSPSPRMSIR